MLTRRKFFFSGLIAGISFGISPLMKAEPLTVESKGIPKRKLLENNQNLKNFLNYKGELFLVSGGEGARMVEQLELSDVIDAGSNDQLEQFWLRFKAPHNSTLRKDVYYFEHAEGGKFPLWIEPAEGDIDGKYFEARFTLLKNFRLP